MKIELKEHPAKRHVQISKADKRHLYVCPKCKDDVVEQAGRNPGRPVRCEACKEKCEPKIIPALPDQHGIYLEGKCVGYCTKESDPEIWFVEKLDPYVIEQVNAHVLSRYGGESLVHEKPEWPEQPAEDEPPQVDEIDELEDDSE